MGLGTDLFRQPFASFFVRIATNRLAFERNTEVEWHHGNYWSYIEDLKKRKGPDADQPQRVVYKKLVRE